METDLITALAQFGPWVPRLRSLSFSGKKSPPSFQRQRKIGGRAGLSGMNEQFIANMRLFVETNAKLEAGGAGGAGRNPRREPDIHTELVRRKWGSFSTQSAPCSAGCRQIR